MVDNAPQVSQSITSIHKKSKPKDVPSSTTASSDSSHKHKSERKSKRYKEVQAEVLTTFNELQEVEKELGSAANDILARMDSLFSRRRDQYIREDDNIEKDDDGEIGKPGYGWVMFMAEDEKRRATQREGIEGGFGAEIRWCGVEWEIRMNVDIESENESEREKE